jgi:hypothetical protein
MTYRASRGNVVRLILIALGFVAIFLVTPGISFQMRLAGFLFFGPGVGGFAVPACATTRITVTDDTVTLGRFKKKRTLRVEESEVSWRRMLVSLTKLGWTITVRDKRGTRPGMQLALFGFSPETIQALQEHLAKVIGQGPNASSGVVGNPAR